jgi:glycosyltransferase involved in cell wall biosynthesis
MNTREQALERNPKLVSIVLPVFNGARFLRQALDSCLQQTYRDLELIVVDNGSTDNSAAIVQSYHDPRITLLRHPTNRKVAGALNTGFRHARGAYLTWTAHDDYYAPTAIAEMVQVLEANPHVHIVFANEYYVDDADNILSFFKTGPVEQLAERNCIELCFLYRRIVYETVGAYDARAFLAEDYDYWLRASAYFTFAHLDRPLLYVREHVARLSTRYGRGEVTEVALAIRRRALGRDLRRNRTILSRVHVTAAGRLYEIPRRAAAGRALLWALAFDPRCLREYRVKVLLARLCVGPHGVRFLQWLKQTLRRLAAYPP